ncbi:unnamed protein product, partial [Polarella glacialis]
VDDCSICLEPGSDVITRCGHSFHRTCIEAALEGLGQGGAGACPLCRQEVRKRELLERQAEAEASSAPLGREDPGAKVCAVIEFLEANVLGKADSYLGKPHK